jgi:hypothetical protein
MQVGNVDFRPAFFLCFWDRCVGQRGTMRLLDFQLIAMEFSGLSRKFFTLLFTTTLGQMRGTAWDSAIA